MAAAITLHDLIEALANAVIEAQDRIERHQIGLISRYFDNDQRPVSVEIRLPSLSPRTIVDGTPQDPEDVFLNVPLLALVNMNLLRIKDFQVDFSLDLGGIIGPEETAAPGADTASVTPEPDAPVKEIIESRPIRSVQVDLSTPKPRSAAGAAAGGPTAKVMLRVEGQEPTEGMARLLGHLNKRIDPERRDP